MASFRNVLIIFLFSLNITKSLFSAYEIMKITVSLPYILYSWVFFFFPSCMKIPMSLSSTKYLTEFLYFLLNFFSLKSMKSVYEIVKITLFLSHTIYLHFWACSFTFLKFSSINVTKSVFPVVKSRKIHFFSPI